MKKENKEDLEKKENWEYLYCFIKSKKPLTNNQIKYIYENCNFGFNPTKEQIERRKKENVKANKSKS